MKLGALLIGVLGVFVLRPAFAQSGFMGAATPAAEPIEEEEEETKRLRGHELRRRFPQIELRALPRCIQGSVGFGTYGLYLPFGIGGTLDLYPTSWLRMGLTYSLGFTFQAGSDDQSLKLAFGQYADALVGVRVFGTISESDFDLPLGRPSRGAVAHVVPVAIPSSHQVFVEAGAMTAFVGLRRCTENCEGSRSAAQRLAPVNRQIVLPLVGVRYVYYAEALTGEPAVHVHRYYHAFAQLLVHPLNAPSGDLLLLSGSQMERARVGARVGGSLPLGSGLCLASLAASRPCARIEVSVGYLPFPALALLEAHIRWPIQ